MGSYQNPEVNASDAKREKKAIKIASSDGAVRQLSKNAFEVRSQAWEIYYYRVERLENNPLVFSCNCKDFQYRIANNIGASDLRECKHIKSVKLYLKHKELIQRIEQVPELPKICPKCQSTKIVKFGFRILRTGFKRQTYRCLQCRSRFSIGESGFWRVTDPIVVVEALNLVYSGMSYRACTRHINLSHGTQWHHTTILRWIKKYTQIMKEFVDKIAPTGDDVWCLDEMMVNVKDTEPTGIGFYDWAWSIISPQTRYILAVEVSKQRETKDARKIIAKGKEISQGEVPTYLVTDSLMTYRDAFVKELDARKTLHIKTNAIRDGFQNRPIERWHNEVRAVTKTRRGLGNDESAKDFLDGYRIYRNFTRPQLQQAFYHPTPCAKIDLKLNPENKLKDLIVKSATNKEIADGKFALHLGERVKHVEILNEKDCIVVKPKGWLDKQVWKEINDILRVHQFAWLSNGRDSCWIRMNAPMKCDNGSNPRADLK